MTDYHKIKSKFIQIYENIAEQRGYNPLIGHILALFLIHKDPLTQADLEKMTGYSRSAISRALDQMTKMGTLNKRRQAGTKTIVYSIETSVSRIMASALQRWLQGVITMQEDVKKMLQDYPTQPPLDISEEEFKTLKLRLQDLNSFADKAKKLFSRLIQELIKE